ncbi:hypothetical protein [Cellvibrio japonicus]|uniref:Uncharacterized protein n=1 Tax=Cellvibrio japonicus (strain Ueda107) TaxID=498211 RepID=B3PHL8_CELJU|nr:hypothetical protein [Cellvibrio japonicus]ACE83698.1 hypothetical protein CJA_2019 [Cellvibrio japonicus Ueda107]QEI12491.1 hypothetical protein FY117_09825 [Cellvibrio japonicus]QEI16065.1 hypothetical protein FY116_09830 [Cellvibrio japonicus]QEI19643.1 hypothetical protein FY115_09825 [Cellvibrio japonicus]
MITYLYWFAVIAVSLFVFWGIGRYFKAKVGFIGGLIVLIIGWGMYVFHYEQYFVKHWGGVMTLTVPDGEMHMQATWKDDNLWIENYDPAKNQCIFREYSKGNLLEGRVTIKNCNPLLSKPQ